MPLRKERVERFQNGDPEISGTDSARAIAKALHPKRQYLKIAQVIDRGEDCKSFVLAPDPDRGTSELAYFAAGQYLTVFENVNGAELTHAYSISSAPKASLVGIYEITVRKVEGGLLSQYIFENWQTGAPVTVSAPAGTFTYQPLRDAPTVIGLAGGSGITPFMSLANAIADGDEDLDLVLLSGSRDEANILFREELDAIAAGTDRVKVVHVLSDAKPEDVPEGMEQGFITAELIKKYAPEGPYSVFLCGSQQMYAFMDTELQKLGLARKYIRRELFGEPHGAASFPDRPAGVPAQVTIRVSTLGGEREARGSSDDTVLQILEKNGVAAPARCRSGECGFCHSRLLKGEVWVPPALERRRLADQQFGCFHPCCSFPLTDLVIEIPEP